MPAKKRINKAKRKTGLPAKKPGVKNQAAKKSVAKKSVAKKSAAKKSAAKKPVAKKPVAKKRAMKKTASKPVSPRKGSATVARRKTAARAEPMAGRAGTMPRNTLVAMAIASLQALRADIDAGTRHSAARGRAASKPKLDKTLATALEQLEADYARVLGSA